MLELSFHNLTIINGLNAHDRAIFDDKYSKLGKSGGTNLVLAVLGFNYLYMREWGMFILFLLFSWFTFGIWWIVNIVKAKSKVLMYNDKIALQILQELQLMHNLKNN